MIGLNPEVDSAARPEVRAGFAGLLAAGLAWGALQAWPQADVEVFARGSARLAALLTGAPIVRVDEGWLMGAMQPVVVSAVCSATSYFLAVVALLAWWFAQSPRPLPVSVALAIVAAFPLTLAVNAVRVVAVMNAHRWVIPRFPDAYASFLHLLVGVAVFLPALIGLNLLLEFYGNARRRS